MNHLKKLSVYTFVGFFGAGVSFLLIPVLSHYMSPADNGYNALISTYVTIIIPVVGLVASGLIQVEYYHLEDKHELASLFSSVQLIPVLPTFLLAIVTLLFYPHLSGILELPPADKWWALSVFPIAWLSIYIESALGYQVIRQQARSYAIFNLSRTVVEISLTMLFVIVLRMGWKGRLLSWLISTLIYSAFSLWYFRKEGLISRNIQLKYMRQGILFGAPLILHTIGKFIVNQSDRLFIAKMISVDEAGIYSIGYTMGTVILILSTAFANLLTPMVMERLKNLTPESRRGIVRLSYLGIGGLAVAVVVLQAVTPALFRYFIDSRYASGSSYVFWVSLGYFFWGVYMIFVTYVFYYKKNSFLAWLALINVIVNICLNFLLIPRYGGLGAAYATAISFFIIMVLVIWYATRLVSLPWLRPAALLNRNRDHE